MARVGCARRRLRGEFGELAGRITPDCSDSRSRRATDPASITDGSLQDGSLNMVRWGEVRSDDDRKEVLLSTKVEKLVEAAIASFPSRDASEKLRALLCPSPRRREVLDVYGKRLSVTEVADFLDVQIVLRLDESATERWGVISHAVPVADDSWYSSLWEATMAAGIWPTPPGYTFD